MKLTEWRLKMMEDVSAKLDKISGVADRATAKMDKLQGEVKQTADSFKQVEARVGGLERSASNIGKFGGFAVGLATIRGGAQMVLSFSEKAFEAKMQAESLDNAIKFSGGRQGIANLQKVEQMSNKLGQNLMVAKEGYALLSGSAIGTKFTNSQINDLYEATTGALTVMGRGPEDQKGALLAIGQIMSKGKVQAEELRGQLGERIPGAFNIAARAMGVTQQELNKLMDDGKLLSEDFLPKFAKELKKTFEGALPAAMASSRAEMGRLDNQIDKTMVRLGSQLEDVAVGWKRFNAGFLNFVSDLLPDEDRAQPLYALTAEMNNQFDTLLRLNPKTDEAAALRAKMNAMYPQFLRNLLDEKTTIEQIASAQAMANTQLSARYQQAVGDSKVENLSKKRDELATAVAEQQRMILELQGRKAFGKEAGLFETIVDGSLETQIQGAEQWIHLWSGEVKKLTEQIQQENKLTFDVRLQYDRVGLLNEAKSIQDLARAMYGDGAGDYSNASASAVANLVTAANRKFGSQVRFDTFGLKQDKKGNWTFSDAAGPSTGEGAGGGLKTTATGTGGPSRAVTVHIGTLAKIDVHVADGANIDELVRKLDEVTNQTLIKAVQGAEVAIAANG